MARSSNYGLGCQGFLNNQFTVCACLPHTVFSETWKTCTLILPPGELQKKGDSATFKQRLHQFMTAASTKWRINKTDMAVATRAICFLFDLEIEFCLINECQTKVLNGCLDGWKHPNVDLFTSLCEQATGRQFIITRILDSMWQHKRTDHF